MINSTICFFSHMFLVFLMLLFCVRRCDDRYLSCAYVPRQIKFTKSIDKSVEKNKPISCKHRGSKILLELARKILFEQKYIFL